MLLVIPVHEPAMSTVTMLEAKTHLSQMVDAVESGAESEIVIARNGRPAAKLVSIGKIRKHPIRLGLEDGRYPPMSLEDFDEHNHYIARLFSGDAK